MKLDLSLDLDTIITSANIAELLDEDVLNAIGKDVIETFNSDLESRSGWEKKMEDSMKLALQVVEAKSFPWPGASNVKFPLITIAALQYHARSYPTLINGDNPVRCRVFGDDKDGLKKARAERVESHMSYQIIEQDEAWEQEMDKVLITQPIIGCAFKKSYYDPIRKHNISENILAKDLVVDYWTKSLDTASRISHILYYSSNDVYERVARNLWLETTDTRPGTPTLSGLGYAQETAQGISMPSSVDESTPFEYIEQHRFLDLDGDGYAEPYICTVRRDTKQVSRIVSRFFKSSIERNDDGKILSIVPEQYFTKYPFVPAPDGSFYDLGFGVLLGPLNDSINTLINQLVDAGTMANTAGGFLSKGIKLRGGNYSFAPLEWKHVDTTGDDLRKGIIPLPVREPSQVLFTLLSMLIGYGERIGGSVDILSGVSPGQNTPAETSRNSVEQGMKIFSGIFKRTYRSMRDEFRKLYRLNQLYLPDSVEFVTDAGDQGIALWKDYEGKVTDVRPSADPHLVSESQRVMQAESIRAAAMSNPMYNRYEVEKNYLKSIRVNNIELILPDPKGPNAQKPPVDIKIQIAQLNAQTKQADMQLQMKLGLLKLMKEAEVAQAKIQKMEAEAMLITEEAKVVGDNTKANMINMQINAEKARHEGILRSVEVMSKAFDTMKEGEPELPKAPPTTQGA